MGGMFEIDALLDAADTELRAFADRPELSDPHSWALPTPCAGWSVADLTEHLAAVAFRQAESFHRARVGGREAPAPMTIDVPPASLPRALHAAADHLTTARKAMDAATLGTVPLPVATLPARTAAAALVVEYGVHRHDLSVALGDTDPTLSAATAHALWSVAPGLLAMLARPAGERPLAYRFEAPSGAVTLGWDGRRWSDAIVPDGPVAAAYGSEADLGLLLLRRVDVRHDAIAWDDPAGLADHLFDHLATL